MRIPPDDCSCMSINVFISTFVKIFTEIALALTQWRFRAKMRDRNYPRPGRNIIFFLHFCLVGEVFEGLEEGVLKIALKQLQKEKKAEVIGEDGVKFF